MNTVVSCVSHFTLGNICFLQICFARMCTAPLPSLSVSCMGNKTHNEDSDFCGLAVWAHTWLRPAFPAPPCPIALSALSPQEHWPTRSSNTVNHLQSQGLCTGCSFCPGNSSLLPPLPLDLNSDVTPSGKPLTLIPQPPTQYQIGFSCYALMGPVYLFNSTSCNLSFCLSGSLTPMAPY